MNKEEYAVEFLAQGDLFLVQGLQGASCCTGVKPSGNPDLALIVADEPMTSAAMFTKNACAAAPVLLSRARLQQEPLTRSVVINSGNANALTGTQGHEDALAMLHTLEESCGGPGFVMSTGIIGVPLPTKPILQGIRDLSQTLSTRDHQVTQAILTTDTCEKKAAARIYDPTQPTTRTWTVGGMAKGSGMIHPNMATMLAVIATDLPLPAKMVQEALQSAVEQSFHQISVDGDTSTNDTVLLLARSPSSDDEVSPALFDTFQQALNQVAHSLAQQIVSDGEGASRWMDIEVKHAISTTAAHQVAEAIACSPLVKTALAGGNPNWGRILSAVGNAQVPVSPEKLSLSLGPHQVFRQGQPVEVDPDALTKTFAAPRVSIVVDLGAGTCGSHITTIDLTHKYIEINAEYTT